ncbi:MAG TPA: hypothetical protein VMM78_10880 [Thermomicrobiales bacterium]|nr:hypothetical protein [Thermomicrobiales bacterium]
MTVSSSAFPVVRHGEVIETSTTRISAESDVLHILPELGSLARIDGMTGQPTTYGVVSFGSTGGLDTSRKAVRRGAPGVSDQAIYQRHPELEIVLRTTFEVAVIGYGDGTTFHHHLPALPAPLHFSVRSCSAVETQAFCHEPRYLSALLTYRGELSPEQLVASHLRWVDRTLDDDHEWLRDATRRLARLMKRDYDLLATLLLAIEPVE